MASSIPRIKLTKVRAALRRISGRSLEDVLQRVGIGQADEALELAALLHDLAKRWRRNSVLTPAVRAAAVAVDLANPPLAEQLHGLPLGEVQDAGDLRRCAVLASRVLASSFAQDGGPVVGQVSEADLTLALVAWLVREMPIIDAIGEMDRAAAAKVLNALELDPATWVPTRVQRLAAEYELNSYGKKKKK